VQLSVSSCSTQPQKDEDCCSVSLVGDGDRSSSDHVRGWYAVSSGGAVGALPLAG